MDSVGGEIGKIGLKLRGPNPPHKVCPSCGSESSEAWENPLLKVMKRLGHYGGETTGGVCLCERCEKPFNCAECSDTGWIEYREEGEEFQRVKRCACDSQSRSVKGMPVEFHDAGMDNFILNAERRVAKESGYRWLRNEVNDLYIRGPVGVGKTRLLASLLNEVVKRKSAAFVRVPELLDRMRMSGFGPASTTQNDESEYLAIYQRVEVLGLDDVGADKGSDYGRRMLQTLYEHRMDHGKRTIWTSNLTLSELEEFFGDERLCSRIAGNADVVSIGGVDMRVEGY